ncbi:hypothetical protein TTRE_0000890201 [Trichuris trichiura]|uniref:Uncharacterized protein n=1 Tax=Trichuris trichiura TaxID=36087 RepID=A0A077ZJC1_TRITR|nr:hypothetical protein TTRE_0000890201 [Trichuris trichiura]
MSSKDDIVRTALESHTESESAEQETLSSIDSLLPGLPIQEDLYNEESLRTLFAVTGREILETKRRLKRIVLELIEYERKVKRMRAALHEGTSLEEGEHPSARPTDAADNSVSTSVRKHRGDEPLPGNSAADDPETDN